MRGQKGKVQYSSHMAWSTRGKRWDEGQQWAPIRCSARVGLPLLHSCGPFCTSSESIPGGAHAVCDEEKRSSRRPASMPSLV